ncbi:MAG: hypothetical protein JRF04_05895 [Deltaproteobacteria bacterium]|nr:hypothetical protein [Deltaproteobacteria bacterium]
MDKKHHFSCNRAGDPCCVDDWLLIDYVTPLIYLRHAFAGMLLRAGFVLSDKEGEKDGRWCYEKPIS